MSLIPFPSVPNVPGVPVLARLLGGTGIVNIGSDILSQDGPLVQQANVWGVFAENSDLSLTAETVGAVEVSKEYRISSYPIELGSFGAYNKVEAPGQYRVTMIQGDVLASRTNFLQQVAQAVDSTELFTVVTPEASYPSVNPTSYSYSRHAESGATMLKVEIMCEEVRTTATSGFSNTQSPNGADPVNNGAVQGVQLTEADYQDIENTDWT